MSAHKRRWLTRKEWKRSPLRNKGFLKIAYLFLLCVECHRRHSYLCRIGRLSGVRYNGRHRESLCTSGLRSPEPSAQVRRVNSCTSACKPAHIDASITRTGRNGWVRVEDGRGRSRTATESLCGLEMNQSLSQPIKCIPLTVHKAPELTKLQAASYVKVR